MAHLTADPGGSSGWHLRKEDVRPTGAWFSTAADYCPIGRQVNQRLLLRLNRPRFCRSNHLEPSMSLTIQLWRNRFPLASAPPLPSDTVIMH